MKNKILLIGGLIVAVFAGTYFSFKATNAVGSVSIGNEYKSTTTLSTSASSTKAWSAIEYPGTLGSVIISSSSPVTTYPPIKIYDATSTMATATSRVIAQFGTSNQTHGTYTYDASAYYGILIETPVGFNGVYTVTYR